MGFFKPDSNLVLLAISPDCYNEKSVESCRSWSSEGHCERLSDLMKSYCRLECGFCERRETPKPKEVVEEQPEDAQTVESNSSGRLFENVLHSSLQKHNVDTSLWDISFLVREDSLGWRLSYRAWFILRSRILFVISNAHFFRSIRIVCSWLLIVVGVLIVYSIKRSKLDVTCAVWIGTGLSETRCIAIYFNAFLN